MPDEEPEYPVPPPDEPPDAGWHIQNTGTINGQHMPDLALADPALCDPALCDPALCDRALCDRALLDLALCDPDRVDPAGSAPRLSDPLPAEPLPADPDERARRLWVPGMEKCNLLLDVVEGAHRRMAAEAADRAVALDAVQTHLRSLVLPGRPVAESARDASGREIPRWSPQRVATETLVSEVSALLRQTHDQTRALLYESERLVQSLPATLSRLRVGDISYDHARVMVDQSGVLPDEVLGEFEDRVLKDAEWLSIEQLRRRAVRVRERLNPESISRRHKKAVAERCVRLKDTFDGMSFLDLFLPTDDAHAIFDRLTRMAKDLRTTDEDGRTRAHLRADIATDLLIEGVTAAGLGHGVRATVNVTVPVMTLMGHSDEPGILDGTVPIDPETARRLAGTATGFTRLLVHPETGVVLSVGRDRYAVTPFRRGCARRSRFVIRRAGSLAAPGRPPTMMSTTPTTGLLAVKPICRISLFCADTRTGSNTRPDGRSNRTRRACCTGAARLVGTTPAFRTPA